MSKSRWLGVTSTAVILGGILSACADNPTAAKTDARITADVKAAIARHPDLGPPNEIAVDTRDHVVYLSGLVDTSLTAANAQDVASHVRGVARVESNISVDR